MKKLITVAALIVLTGCDSANTTEKSRQSGHRVMQHDIDGHLYLAIENGGIIHAEHCACKTAK